MTLLMNSPGEVLDKTLDTDTTLCENPVTVNTNKSGKPRRKLQETTMNKEDLVSTKEAAQVFGLSEEELEKATANNFGIMPISAAADLLGINRDTLYAAAGRYSKFPEAVTRPYGKDTGVKLLSILHRQFITWRRDKYNPHDEDRSNFPTCKINELVGETYNDEDGIVRKVEPCTNQVPRRDHKFCSVEHAVLYRQVKGDYSEMGKRGKEGKGKTGPRDRSGTATSKRSKAAIKGQSGATKPTQRKRFMMSTNL